MEAYSIYIPKFMNTAIILFSQSNLQKIFDETRWCSAKEKLVYQLSTQSFTITIEISIIHHSTAIRPNDLQESD